MRPVRFAIAVLLAAICPTLIATGAMAQRGAFHTPPNCWTEPRIYHAGPISEALRRNVSVERVARDREFDDGGVSPNGAYRFRLDQLPPDDDLDLPWRAEFLIDNERDYLVRVFVDDSRDASAEWISEKLLFMRLWWGRIAASDFIFDVEAERFVYEEMVWYGGIAFQQFQASCQNSCPYNFNPAP